MGFLGSSTKLGPYIFLAFLLSLWQHLFYFLVLFFHFFLPSKCSVASFMERSIQFVDVKQFFYASNALIYVLIVDLAFLLEPLISTLS